MEAYSEWVKPEQSVPETGKTSPQVLQSEEPLRRADELVCGRRWGAQAHVRSVEKQVAAVVVEYFHPAWLTVRDSEGGAEGQLHQPSTGASGYGGLRRVVRPCGDVTPDERARGG